jgi:hypothetical protein
VSPASPSPAEDSREYDRFVGHSLATSMYFPASRLFVAGNPKAAGTSMRWWLLRSHGVAVDTLTALSWWGESAPYQTVWDDSVDLRFTWAWLPPADRETALVAPDVLSVLPVRNPVTRAFSAWSGKYLSGEPYYAERLPAAFPALPERVTSAAQVADLFEEFVNALSDHVAGHPEWDGIDVHFWPQHRLLARPVVGETLLLQQESLAAGLTTIESRLREHGVTPVENARLNETVVGYDPALVSERALDALIRLYDADFSAWGYEPERPAGQARPIDVEWLNDVRGRNQRYGVIHRALMDRQHELEGAHRRESELLDSTSWRITAGLRWLSGRTRRH